MGAIGTTILLVVLVVVVYAGYQIVAQHWVWPKPPCPNGLALFYPANKTVTVPACPAGTVASSVGPVALLPTTLGPGCPVQILGAAAAGVGDPGDGLPFRMSTTDVGAKYTSGSRCGAVQVGLLRYCRAEGQAFPGARSACTGTGIGAASGPAAITAAPGGGCLPGGGFTVVRRAVAPLDISKASDVCPLVDMGGSNTEVTSLTLDPGADYPSASKKKCSQPLGEFVFYECPR